MGLSPSERIRGLGHINIQKGLGNVEAVSLQRILLHPFSLPYVCSDDKGNVIVRMRSHYQLALENTLVKIAMGLDVHVPFTIILLKMLFYLHLAFVLS